MFQTDFQFETPGQAIETSTAWELATGSSTAMTFAGSAPNVRVQVGAAVGYAVTINPPSRPHQRAEIDFDYDTSSYHATVIGDGPIAYWRFGEAAGSLAYDSVQGFNANYQGGFTLGATSLLTGDNNPAVTFSGGYADAGNRVSFQITSGTVEAWVKTGGPGSGLRGIVSKPGAWGMYLNGGVLGLYDYSANTFVSTGVNLADGVRHHVAYTFTIGSTLSANLYVDGVLKLSTTIGLSGLTQQNNLLIGENGFTGVIDEPDIYGYPISQAQVTNHYNLGTTGASASTLFMGVFCRYVDAANFVMARVDCKGNRSLQLIERIAGVNTTLASVGTGIFSPSATIRLEVIGSRARVWYEGCAANLDRPPDIAGALAGNPSTVGDSGFYMESNATNGMHVKRYASCDLPSSVLPPPTMNATGPSMGYNFTPITLSKSGNWVVGGWTEWQVTPVDWADFPEPYTFVSDISVTGPVVFVRNGYNYDVRARLIGDSGPGAWTPWTRVNAIGTASTGGPPDPYFATQYGSTSPATTTKWNSKSWQTVYWPGLVSGSVGDTNPSFPTAQFPNVQPDYVLELTNESAPTTFKSNTGRERVASTQVRPRQSFKMTFDTLTQADYQVLIDFFEFSQSQNLPFKWPHPMTGVVYTLRFSVDDYEIDYTDTGLSSPIAKLSFSVTEATIGVVSPTLPVRLLADSSLV